MDRLTFFSFPLFASQLLQMIHLLPRFNSGVCFVHSVPLILIIINYDQSRSKVLLPSL